MLFFFISLLFREEFVYFYDFKFYLIVGVVKNLTFKVKIKMYSYFDHFINKARSWNVLPLIHFDRNILLLLIFTLQRHHFSIMVNDIVKSSACSQLVKFADDITVSVPVARNGEDHAEDEDNNIKKWSTLNGVCLNLDKTKELVLRRNIDHPSPLAVHGISQVSELKLSGVYFNSNPTNWDSQFKFLMDKANSRMYILRTCKSHGYSVDDLHVLFHSLIMSIFTYAIQVWGVASFTKYLANIDRLQNRALKFGDIADS